MPKTSKLSPIHPIHLRVHGLQPRLRLGPLLRQTPHAQLLLAHHLAQLANKAFQLLRQLSKHAPQQWHDQQGMLQFMSA